MKRTFYIKFFMFLPITFSVLTHKITHSSTIGLGLSSIFIDGNRQKYVKKGFELALDNFLNKELRNKVIINFNENNTPKSPDVVANNLIEEGCELLFGFPSSYEAMLSYPVIHKNKTFLITSSSFDEIDNYNPLIHSIGISLESLTEKLAFLVNHYHKMNKGLLITNNNLFFSQIFSKSVLKNKNINIDSTKIVNEKIPQDIIKKLNSGIYHYLIITNYPEQSIDSIKQLIKLKKHIPIYANHSWSMASNTKVKDDLSKYKSDIFTFSYWASGSEESKKFETLSKKNFGEQFHKDLAYGYDFGVIAAKMLTEKEVNKVSYEIQLKNGACFDNTSSGRLCLKPNGGFMGRKLFVLKFNKYKGFIPY